MITDPLFYLLAVPAVVALGLSKGGFAGVGQVATPMLALIMPPLEAAALLLPIMMLQDAMSVWVYRKDWDAWNLKVMLPGAVLGIGIAWVLAAYISDAAVRLLVGAVSAIFVLNTWFRRRPAPAPPSAGGGVFWGAASGFTSTLCQAGSPPFQMHVLPQNLPKLTFVGTTAIFFAVVNAVKVGPFFALGQFTPQNLATCLALVPLAIAANLLGVWLVRITPQVLFYRIAQVLILLISLELIRAGGMALWWR